MTQADECHHATAATYRQIIAYFHPDFLLGLTATPERMDNEDVFQLFDQNVPYELRLRDAIINGLVVPFHYYGIRDKFINYNLQGMKGHRFIESFSTEEHCDFICSEIEKHRPRGEKLKALAFCKNVSHAIRMQQALGERYHTRYLTGKNSVGERLRAYRDLQDEQTDLEILCTIGILNEGVDIPGVNMVLFLRPTESSTIFIQQLGRGLRRYEGKKYVTVLDFIGKDYRRSMQIAFALGSLSQNFVVEERLVAELVKTDFSSLGLDKYDVEIHMDALSKEEILDSIEHENLNRMLYVRQDYQNFKKYIGAESYPRHVDYLNTDYAPDLLHFMQIRIGRRKAGSYYGFLKGIEEESSPSFDDAQADFIRYVSGMLPLVRDTEFLIFRCLIEEKIATYGRLSKYCRMFSDAYSIDKLNHALKYMIW